MGALDSRRTDMTSTGGSLDWSIEANDTYGLDPKTINNFYDGRRTAALWISGISSHEITLGARKAGTSDTFEDVDGGGPFTVDKVYMFEFCEGLEYDFRCTNGSGAALVKIIG